MSVKISDRTTALGSTDGIVLAFNGRGATVLSGSDIWPLGSEVAVEAIIGLAEEGQAEALRQLAAGAPYRWALILYRLAAIAAR